MGDAPEKEQPLWRRSAARGTASRAPGHVDHFAIVFASLPSLPFLPFLPRITRLPCLPCLPCLLRIPRLPALPSATSLPSLPRLPSLPSLPRLPSLSSIPYTRCSARDPEATPGWLAPRHADQLARVLAPRIQQSGCIQHINHTIIVDNRRPPDLLIVYV